MPVASASPDQEDYIDWPGIRAAAVVVGVREAARQAGRDLPPDELERFTQRVMKRCSREGWLAQIANAQPSPVRIALPLSAPVRTGADALSEVLAEDERETRISLSRSARRLAADAETAPLDQAGDVLQAAKVAALVHGWAEQRIQTDLRISIYAGPQEKPVVDI